MTTKFGLNYNLFVQTATNDTLVVKPPFTVEFDITRNFLTSQNVASIRIYNLSATNRDQIRKNVSDYDVLRKIRLEAGYEDRLSTIFAGEITQAWSVREGVNFITQAESFDGGFAAANGISTHAFPPGTDQATILRTIMTDLPGVAVGTVGSYPGQISRGNAYNGSTVDLLRELTNGGFFIDNGKAHCLGLNECLQGDIEQIDPAAGLLNTPVREQTVLNFDMLFEPRLVIGQVLRLVSTTERELTGIYKVVSIKHRGMISESVAGDAVTSVGLFAPLGTQTLQTVGLA